MARIKSTPVKAQRPVSVRCIDCRRAFLYAFGLGSTQNPVLARCPHRPEHVWVARGRHGCSAFVERPADGAPPVHHYPGRYDHAAYDPEAYATDYENFINLQNISTPDQ